MTIEENPCCEFCGQEIPVNKPREKRHRNDCGFTDEDLAVEVVARFTGNYGRNGRWSQRIKQAFIDGAMWAKEKEQ